MAVALIGRAPSSLPSNTKISPKEHAKEITTRSGRQLPEIHVKRLGINPEITSLVVEKTIKHNKQIKESTPAGGPGKSQDKAIATVNPHEPPIPFPQRLKKQKSKQPYKRFLEVYKKLHINIPFVEALVQMPSYIKFLKNILSNKCKLEEHETIMLTGMQLQNSEEAPTEIERSREFYCDYSDLQLAGKSLTHPKEIIEDVFIKVEKFIFSVNFLILDMEEDEDIPLILGKPFLATGRTLIDVQNGQLILRLGEEHISFNVFKVMKLPTESDSCFQIDVIDEVVQDSFLLHNPSNAYEACIANS
ncbi:uncharacterized protein LOC111398327 [Olea europaea var. sylvestris]|uniref:uncharacterized protein LOC111398327 n=1 Tax=Olea europaea var. sylvestris TaxID=158386 RepID=UPI000C1CD50F|nr:uncharacterized protein LOC111398327 [Olea europaea var. sylvestris]